MQQRSKLCAFFRSLKSGRARFDLRRYDVAPVCKLRASRYRQLNETPRLCYSSKSYTLAEMALNSRSLVLLYRRKKMAEGAGFEPAAHGVGAGFQDRWFQPLTHPSDKGIQLLTPCALLAGESVLQPRCKIPNAFATSDRCRWM